MNIWECKNWMKLENLLLITDTTLRFSIHESFFVETLILLFTIYQWFLFITVWHFEYTWYVSYTTATISILWIKIYHLLEKKFWNYINISQRRDLFEIKKYVTRSFINSLIEYYSKSFNNILKTLILFEIKISNNRLNRIQTNSLVIKLTSRVYISDLAVVLFYNLTHIYISIFKID